MVLGLAALGASGLASVLVAGASAAAMGYNYGYHVRRGYHDFKPSNSANTRNQMKAFGVTEQSGASGALAAEQRFTQEPNLANEVTKITSPEKISPSVQPQETVKDIVYSKSGKYAISRAQKNQMDREQYRAWYNEESQISSRQSYMPRKLTRSSRYSYTY